MLTNSEYNWIFLELLVLHLTPICSNCSSVMRWIQYGCLILHHTATDNTIMSYNRNRKTMREPQIFDIYNVKYKYE